MFHSLFRSLTLTSSCSHNLLRHFPFLKRIPRSFKTKVLGWGNNDYGQLGLGFQHQVPLPTLLSWDSTNESNIKYIGCGEAYSFLITQKGELYSCGEGEQHQNGHSGTVKQWTKVNFDLPVCEVVGGKYHTLLLTENGEVYSMGENSMGQLGYFQSKIQQQPKRIDAFKGVKIISVVTGSNHNLAIDEHGTVYVWGINHYGQAGQGNADIIWEPKPLTSLDGHKVMKVAAGLYHSLLLTTTGELYGMGSNKQGQLGLGERIRQIPVPTPIRTFQLKPNERIVDVVCGLTHNLVLTNQGNLFGFGGNQYYQVWRGTHILPSKTIILPFKFPSFSTQNQIRLICAGSFHSFVVMGDNELWAWGLGSDFQLGNGKQSSSEPQKIEHNLLQNVKILTIKGGWGHTLALVQENSSSKETEEKT